MRRTLITSSLCLILAGAIATADDSAKPESKDSVSVLPSLTETEKDETSPAILKPKGQEIPDTSILPRPDASAHMAPSSSPSITAATPRIVNADQVLYERAAYQARQRVARIEERKWSGKSMSRPTIGSPSYVVLNPVIYGYPFGIYPPAYRNLYPW